MSEEFPPQEEKQLCFHLGGRLRTELLSHLPFSVSSVTLGLVLAGLLCFLTPAATFDLGGSHPHPEVTEEGAKGGAQGHDVELHGHFVELFHLFHPAHMLFSAAATTAMFRRYDCRAARTLTVGLTGAVFICGLSDILLPRLSLVILGKAPSHWHICFVDHPSLVVPFALVGVALGWLASTSIERTTFFSHSIHVFLSSMASIFYLVGPVGRLAWIDQIGAVFAFTVVAVMVPCCFSDILYPVLLTPRGREAYAHSGHHRH